MTKKVNFLQKFFFIFCFTLSLFCGPSSAQQLFNDGLLDALKRNQGLGSESRRIRSPLNEVREEEQAQDALAGRGLAEEEGEEEEPSRLEEDYQARLDSEITQYGYALFDNDFGDNFPMVGRLSDDYKLGIGDTLIITLQGQDSQSYTIDIDREGQIILPNIPPLKAAGLSYGQFRALLKKQISDIMIGTEVHISLASVRSIAVFVIGEVENPGVIRSSSMANPLEILIRAGGVKKTGSLRNITVYRGGKKTKLDLYGFLDGTASGLGNLNDGDRIVVPTIGGTVALDGQVIRPGIYELPAGNQKISYAAAMALSGGTLRPSGYEISQITLDAEGRQNFREMTAGDYLKNGEALIAHLAENSQTGRVELVGHVKTPGFRPLTTTRTVSRLLGGFLNLKDNPYLLFGLIERVEEKTQTRSLQAFSPENIFNRGQDVTLKDRDRIVFLGHHDIAFLTSNAVRQVIIDGQYNIEPWLPDDKPNPDFCKPLRNLARIINDTQSNRFATAIRAVFAREELKETISSQANRLMNDARDPNLEQPVPANMMYIPKAEAEAEAEAKAKAKEAAERPLACPAIYSDVQNLLPFILEYTVSVDGAVRLPGVYPIISGTSVASLLAVSGGTSNDANLARIEITNLGNSQHDDNIQMQWAYTDGEKGDLSAISVNPGGGIRVNSKFSNFESGAILLSGEFKQPGVYTIRKGEKLSDLISRAGGLTDQAYAYGAIFTRNRVKEIQRSELQKTARHLQSAMISASVKKNIEADSLMAAQQLTDQLSSAEIIGRVVIEADPLKLSLNPALDTVLEAGDALHMPKRPNFIVAMGDVLNPGALQFIPGKGLAEYINEVGSYTRSADQDRIYIVYPNGVARPVSLSSWAGDRDIGIPPGTAIVVPTDLSPYDSLSLIKEIGGIFQNLAVSAASIAVLIRN